MVDVTDGKETVTYVTPMWWREFSQGKWWCDIIGHDFWKEPHAIRNNDGSTAYMARCCKRWGCDYREPTTEEGRRMRNEDRERVGSYMNSQRAGLGLGPLDPKTWVD
jgi:hypothetical protein